MHWCQCELLHFRMPGRPPSAPPAAPRADRGARAVARPPQGASVFATACGEHRGQLLGGQARPLGHLLQRHPGRDSRGGGMQQARSSSSALWLRCSSSVRATSAVVPLCAPRSCASSSRASSSNRVMWKRCSAGTVARHLVPEPPACVSAAMTRSWPAIVAGCCSRFRYNGSSRHPGGHARSPSSSRSNDICGRAEGPPATCNQP